MESDIPPARSDDGSGRPTTVLYGGCLLTGCVEAGGPTGGPVDGPNLLVLFPMELGGYISVCSEPPPNVATCGVDEKPVSRLPPTHSPHPIKAERGSMSYRFGLGRYLGLTFTEGGAVCFNIGAGVDSPISITENRGSQY